MAFMVVFIVVTGAIAHSFLVVPVFVHHLVPPQSERGPSYIRAQSGPSVPFPEKDLQGVSEVAKFVHGGATQPTTLILIIMRTINVVLDIPLFP
jgi:hypothetical protein